MSNMTLVDASSWTGALYRLWHGESRKTGIADIENIISQTIDAITTHSRKKSFLKLIINALASTRVGIESMMTTYRDDPAMIGRLQVQLTNIDLQLEEHRDLIKGYTVDGADENIVDAVVQGTDTDDKEGLKRFLMGSSNSDEKITDRADRERYEREKAEYRRRRRRAKQSMEESENIE
jgi:hypothetical protein